MTYRCDATSVAGFIQQLAVGYVQHGHFFYTTGHVPERKDPKAVDAKLIERYGLDLSRWARARRKELGRASVQYLRHGRFFVLAATAGRHEFFDEESVQDVRRNPIRYGGYSVSYRQGVDRRFHASVRIAPDEYLKLKSFFVGLAVHRSVENLSAEFGRVPFEPYAPIRRQLLNFLRAVNRERKAAGFEPVPVSALRLRRRVVRPFGEESGEKLSRTDAEGVGQSGDIDNGDVSLASFNAADVVSVKPALKAEFLLGPAFFGP